MNFSKGLDKLEEPVSALEHLAHRRLFARGSAGRGGRLLRARGRVEGAVRDGVLADEDGGGHGCARLLLL